MMLSRRCAAAAFQRVVIETRRDAPAKLSTARSASTAADSRQSHVLAATLATDDMKISKAFYSQLFPEWNFKDLSAGGVSHQFSVDTQVPTSFTGNLLSRSDVDDAFNRWLPTFIVDDVSAATELVKKQGGDVASVDANVPSSHRRCSDLFGGGFFLRHRTDEERAADVHWEQTPPAGCINWLDACSPPNAEHSDSETAALEEVLAEFYAGVLNLDVDLKFPMPGGHYILGFTQHGRRNCDKLCGILPGAPLLGDAPSQWLVFFAVNDRDDLIQRTKAAAEWSGVNVMHDTLDIQDGTVSVLTDPTGAAFGIYHRTDGWFDVREYGGDA